MNGLGSITVEFLNRWHSSKVSCPESVYEPAEDSFLLLDSLSSLSLQNRSLLDMGTGSGIVGTFSAMQGASRVVSTDLIPEVLPCARNNAQTVGIEKGKIDHICSDLFSALSPHEPFDFITFNPPYLPSERYAEPGTTSIHSPDGSLRCALDGGGPEGSKVLRRFLRDFFGFLKEGASAFVILSSLNNPRSVREYLHELYGSEVEWKVVSQDSFFFERIFCIELKKTMGEVST